MTAGRSAIVPASGRLTLACMALLCALGAAFALTFPPLSDRVVDQANIIPAVTRSTITAKLAELESKSGIQLVVATVNSLEGQEIEPYANELFRAWGLGQKEKNNGVLLLVAPNENRVRIEVGYGLEGTLTDALSKVIITNAITPRFKTGDFGGGIARGVDDIITVLTTDSSDWQPRPALRLDSQQPFNPAIWLFILFLFIFIVVILGLPAALPYFEAGPQRGARKSGSRSSNWASSSSSNGSSWSSSDSSSSSSDSGGGFSGGGGDSGGGGASGSW